MTQFDDFEDVIAAEIPDEVIEELLRGAFEPELPSELVLVGRVLRAAHGPIPSEDRAREAEVVEAMVAAMRVVPITAARPSTRRHRRALVAVTAAVSVLGIGGVAAAAGGLPGPIQSFVSDSLSHVGVSVPSTDDEPLSPDPQATDGPVVHASDRADEAPGQTGETPGRSGVTPGQSGATPGQSGSEPPGQTGATPGQSGATPGQSGATPGQLQNEPPGQLGLTPGQSDDTPGRSEHRPDDAGKKPDEADTNSPHNP